MKVAVVGGGWAGLAAAVRACEAGHTVTLFDMARQTGGRARAVGHGRENEGAQSGLDNGQHILIGAYRRTLALMQAVGVDPARVLYRCPLVLRYPDGSGLQLRQGPAWFTFPSAVLGASGWSLRDKLALLRAASGWARGGFACDPHLTVDALCRHLPPAVRASFIDPLCAAALNTPAAEASARSLLRVLRDALFGGPGAADLLLPRQSLSDLLPGPAEAWLRQSGASVRLGTRVQQLQAAGRRWQLDGQAFDAVVLACGAPEAARLSAAHAPAFAARAAALQHEPIVTVYLQCPGGRLPEAMMTLHDGPLAPAQFAFDHGRLGGPAGRFAFVVSAARRWVEAGLEATAAAVLQQAQSAFGSTVWPTVPTLLRVLADKRATFRCTTALLRPSADVAPGLIAAGDYVDGPYPSTLEGAVLSGEAAAGALAALERASSERTALPAARR